MRKLTRALMVALSALTLVLAPAAPALAQRKQLLEYPSIHHPTVGMKGMVVSQNEIASQVGAAILRQGGNAVDAAVAVGFALAVTLPRAGNIGGDGFMLVGSERAIETGGGFAGFGAGDVIGIGLEVEAAAAFLTLNGERLVAAPPAAAALALVLTGGAAPLSARRTWLRRSAAS